VCPPPLSCFPHSLAWSKTENKLPAKEGSINNGLTYTAAKQCGVYKVVPVGKNGDVSNVQTGKWGNLFNSGISLVQVSDARVGPVLIIITDFKCNQSLLVKWIVVCIWEKIDTSMKRVSKLIPLLAQCSPGEAT